MPDMNGVVYHKLNILSRPHFSSPSPLLGVGGQSVTTLSVTSATQDLPQSLLMLLVVAPVVMSSVAALISTEGIRGASCYRYFGRFRSVAHPLLESLGVDSSKQEPNSFPIPQLPPSGVCDTSLCETASISVAYTPGETVGMIHFTARNYHYYLERTFCRILYICTRGCRFCLL